MFQCQSPLGQLIADDTLYPCQSCPAGGDPLPTYRVGSGALFAISAPCWLPAIIGVKLQAHLEVGIIAFTQVPSMASAGAASKAHFISSTEAPAANADRVKARICLGGTPERPGLGHSGTAVCYP
jgi:hypothetical protein